MFKFLIPPILWALLILGLTLMPGKFLPETSLADLFKIDKFVHLSIFFGLVYLLITGLKKFPATAWGYKNAVIFSLLIGVIYGALIEVVQQFIPDRSFEYLDMLANTIGCGVAAIVYKIVKKTKN